MQCPLSSGCWMSPKTLFLAIAVFNLALGMFSAVWPERSIGLYQWIMERYNWKVVPIDPAREVRNTRVLGLLLAALSLATFFVVARRF